MSNDAARDAQHASGVQGEIAAVLEVSPSLSAACRELRVSGETLRKRAGGTWAYVQFRARGRANNGVYARGVATLSEEQLDAAEALNTKPSPAPKPRTVNVMAARHRLARAVTGDTCEL